MSNPNSALSPSKSPMLLIDFRSGSVEMRLGPDVWRGQLPMSAADRSQINTPQGSCQLEKTDFAKSLEVGG